MITLICQSRINYVYFSEPWDRGRERLDTATSPSGYRTPEHINYWAGAYLAYGGLGSYTFTRGMFRFNFPSQLKGLKFTLSINPAHMIDGSKAILFYHEGPYNSRGRTGAYKMDYSGWQEIGRYNETTTLEFSELPEGEFQFGFVMSHDFDDQVPVAEQGDIVGRVAMEDENTYVKFDDCEECKECTSEPGSPNDGIGDDGSAQSSLPTGTGTMNFLPQTYNSGVNLSSPNTMTYTSRLGIVEEKLRNSNGQLHQVKNDKGLTQIDIIDDNSYTVTQYDISKVGTKGTDGFYDVVSGAVPTTKLTLSKTSAAPNILDIVQEKNGTAVSKTTYEYNTTDSYWKMGRDTTGDLVIDTYEYVISSTDTNGNPVRTYYLLNSSQNIVSQVTRTYDANYNLLEEIIGPSPKNYVTSYEYTSGNLTKVTYPNNEFVQYVYDTSNRLGRKIESFNGSTFTTNESDHKVTEYYYHDTTGVQKLSNDNNSIESGEPRMVKVWAQGQPISNTFYGFVSNDEKYIIQAVTPTAAISDANNLTTSIYGSTDSNNYDVTKEIGPDLMGTTIKRAPDDSIVITESGVFDGYASGSDIVSGTITTDAYVNDQLVASDVEDIASGKIISVRNIVKTGNVETVTFLDNTTEVSTFSTCCNHLESFKSRDGVTTSYTYDHLGRQETSEVNGVTRKNTYDGFGNIEKVEEFVGGTLIRTVSQANYGDSNELQWTKDGMLNQTDYSRSYVGTNTIETITYPNLKTKVTETDWNGNIVSVTGTGAFELGTHLNAELLVNDATLGYHVIVQKYGQTTYYDDANGARTPYQQWTKTYTNALGQVYKTENSEGAVTKQFYQPVTGVLIKSEAASGAWTLYENNVAQGISIQALDVNRNDTIDYGTDVITLSETVYATENSDDFQITSTWINPSSANPSETAYNVRKVATDGLIIENIITENRITSTMKLVAEIDTDGSITTTIDAPDSTSTVTRTVYGLQEWTKSYDSSTALKSQVTYGYDLLNRLETMTDLRNGTTIYHYNNNDQVTKLITPEPNGVGTGGSQTFETHYNNMGQRAWVKHPDGSLINFDYTDQGLIETASGSQAYPRTYAYDRAGNLKSLKTTYFNGSANLDSFLQWKYYGNGRLKTKIDNQNRAVSYDYYPDGRLMTKTNARNMVKTWEYDSSGRLDKIKHDGIVAVDFSYNSRGRLHTIDDDAGARQLNYNTLGQFTGFTWLSGDLAGISQDYGYDILGRQDSAGFTLDSTTKSNTMLYNTFGLLEKVDTGSHTYNYSYLDQSPYTVEYLEALKNNGGTPVYQMHSKREFDKLMRTTGFGWATGGKN